MPALHAWLRSSRAARALDAALVGAAFVVGLIGHLAARTDPGVEAAPMSAAILVLAAVAAAVLWWRRPRPSQMLGALFVVTLLASAVHDPGLSSTQVGLEMMLLFHAAGSWSMRPRLALGIALAATLLVAAVAAGNSTAILAAGAFALALVDFPFAVGYAGRSRRQYLAAVEERMRRAEAERDSQARQAIEAERARIARELHDVVAHHVSLIGVQAGAARTSLARDPESTRAALVAIERSSRDAVGEMHRLLDVLQPAGGGRELAPQPGLHLLDALLARWRDAGSEVEASVEGNLLAVPPDVSLCAYRVVEESLTNVARHSRASRARVAVHVGGGEVGILVEDPGPAAEPAGPAGRGLSGMRERVALFDGELDAATTADGGFAVRARLPWRR